jgi:hypothetical protein
VIGEADKQLFTSLFFLLRSWNEAARSTRIGPGAIVQIRCALFSIAMVSVYWLAHDRFFDKIETTSMPPFATAALILAARSSIGVSDS